MLIVNHRPQLAPSPQEFVLNLRRKAGYTQQELAGLLGVSSVTVSRWERGIAVPTPHLRHALLKIDQKRDWERMEAEGELEA